MSYLNKLVHIKANALIEEVRTALNDIGIPATVVFNPYFNYGVEIPSLY